ncbi:hypothetical protein Ancab_037422 [Ancistrocladus abbreviatus]
MPTYLLARAAFSPSPSITQCCIRNHTRSKTPTPSCIINTSCPPYKTNTFIFQAARLLGPPARFEASKLSVVFEGEDHLHQHHHPHHNYTSSSKEEALVNVLPAPRIYTLSHCDFTANLTLTISNLINLNQLQGWYNKDDVVAEWKQVKGHMSLHVYCHLTGPTLFLDLASEFRYHIFSKELPLVLQAILHGDSALFRVHPELVDAIVWVYFHSSSAKCNRIECWGPLKDAAQRQQGDGIHPVLIGSENSLRVGKWGSGKSFLQALFTFLLL